VVHRRRGDALRPVCATVGTLLCAAQLLGYFGRQRFDLTVTHVRDRRQFGPAPWAAFPGGAAPVAPTWRCSSRRRRFLVYEALWKLDCGQLDVAEPGDGQGRTASRTGVFHDG